MTNWPPMERRGHTVTEDDVRRFEQHIGHELPDDYRRFLLEVNGGRTAGTHCRFAVRRDARHFETILNALFSLDDPNTSRDLATWQLYGEGHLPVGLEIGADDGASPIVLVLAGPHRGEVWFLDRLNYDHDANQRRDWFDRTDALRIADSFAEFMAGLRPLNDDGT